MSQRVSLEGKDSYIFALSSNLSSADSTEALARFHWIKKRMRLLFVCDDCDGDDGDDD